MLDPVVSSIPARDAPRAPAPARACRTLTYWRIWGRRFRISPVWADDQPFASTGSSMVQTMPEPFGPSRRTLRLFWAWPLRSATL